MKLLKLFKRKEKELTDREKMLLEDYNNGRILQVDKDINNKDFLSKKQNG